MNSMLEERLEVIRGVDKRTERKRQKNQSACGTGPTLETRRRNTGTAWRRRPWRRGTWCRRTWSRRMWGMR
jgi:hypothetical protein